MIAVCVVDNECASRLVKLIWKCKSHKKDHRIFYCHVIESHAKLWTLNFQDMCGPCYKQLSHESYNIKCTDPAKYSQIIQKASCL